MLNTKKKFLCFFLIICFLLLKIRFNYGTHYDYPINDYFQPEALGFYKKWSFNSGGTIVSTPSVYDLEGDGLLEIFFGSNDNKIYCVNSTGGLIWNFTTGGDVVASPVIVDLNHDNDPEIVVGSIDDYLYCLNSNGDLFWSYETDADIQSSAVIVDINNDGLLNVIISTQFWTYCLFHNGSLYWSANFGVLERLIPTVADLNNDGSMEVILPGGNIDILDSGGDCFLSYPFYTHASPAIADFDQNGILDIVVPGEGDMGNGMYCLELDTEIDNFILKWFFSIPGVYILTSPAVADIDQDGFYEVITGNDDISNLLCLSHLGTDEWLMSGDYQFHYPSPAISDINNDSVMEIIFHAQGNLICYDKYGGWLDDILIGSLYSSPIIADVDSDGLSEILI